MPSLPYSPNTSLSLNEQNLIENFLGVYLSVLKVRIELRAHGQSIRHLLLSTKSLYPIGTYFMWFRGTVLMYEPRCKPVTQVQAMTPFAPASHYLRDDPGTRPMLSVLLSPVVFKRKKLVALSLAVRTLQQWSSRH